MDPAITELLKTGGVGAVVMLVCWLLFTGRLVTRRENDLVVHDRDEWRAESRLKDQQIQELSDQNDRLLKEIGPTLTKFLTDMRQVAEDARRKGGA